MQPGRRACAFTDRIPVLLEFKNEADAANLPSSTSTSLAVICTFAVGVLVLMERYAGLIG